MTDLTVIIPAKNEAASLPELFSRLHKALSSSHIRYQAILVDDYSTDSTGQVLKPLLNKYPIVHMLKSGPVGKAYSILQAADSTDSPYLAMLDADLEYPPEALPEMYHLLKTSGHGVVVANRTTSHTNIFRKFASYANKYLLGNFLLRLNCDVQSGLKVFQKDIVGHLDRSTVGAWSLDIPLLYTARELGLTIGTTSIDFVSRSLGISKCKNEIVSAVRQIFLGALKVKFATSKIYHLPPTSAASPVGKGIAFKGQRFTTHSHLPVDHSALITSLPWQKFLVLTLLGLIATGFLISPLNTGIIIISLLSVIYFVDMAFSLWLVLRSLHKPPELTFSPDQLSRLESDKLPLYSILCPLYKEAHVLPQFTQSISELDWPKNKLEVLLLLEENDSETIAAAKSANLPDYFRIIVVPHSQPKTKPKACNYGLHHVRGKYVVVYDAEDRPDPDQLKKSYLGFEKLDASVVCLQAKLNYYNHSQNWLTRLFTAEYSLWFDVVLPGYQSISTTIPLGGTSNHFRTEVLKSVHGWDAFNVTEDCDLGARLFKLGYKTAVIDSTTYEEANSRVGNWMRQRSRWVKGYFQTFLVHNRKPISFIKDHGIHAFIFQLVIGGKTFFMLINPLLWIATISYFAFYPQVGQVIESLYPTAVFYLAGACAVFGNFLFLYYYMIGLAKRGHWSHLKYVFLVPLYWVMTSIAAFKAFYQLVVKPHYWEKTVHGLHLPTSKFVISLRLNFRIPRLPSISVARPSLFVSRMLIAAFWLVVQTAGLYYANSHVAASISIVILTVGGFLISARLTSILAPSWWLIVRLYSDLKGISRAFRRPPIRSAGELRILIFNWRDIRHKWAGGAEVYLHEMAKRWVASGHQVTIFCGGDGKSPSDEVIDGITVIRRGGFYTVYILAPLYYIFNLRNNFDIVIDSENGIPFFTPLFVAVPKILLIHHIHQDLFRSKLYFPMDQIAAFLESRLMPLIYRKQKIVTVSQSSAKDIIKLGLSQNHEVEIIHPGVNPSDFVPVYKTSHPSFVYLGRIRPQKNLDTAIKAFSILRASHPQATFSIAGWGEEIPKLQTLASSLQLGRSVRFLNKISEREKVKLLGESWAMLQPSSFEGWGITVIEANAAGTPVIASNVAGLKDSVVDGQTGLLVPPTDPQALADAMRLLITNTSLRTRFSKSALSWSLKFSWESLAGKFITMLLVHAQSTDSLVISTQPAYDPA